MTVLAIEIIWIIFVLVFLGLSIFHFIQSGKKVTHFKVSERPLTQLTVDIAGADIDKPLKDFVNDFNSYIDNYNKLTAKQNRIAAFGYLLASIVAIFSLILVLINKTE